MNAKMVLSLVGNRVHTESEHWNEDANLNQLIQNRKYKQTLAMHVRDYTWSTDALEDYPRTDVMKNTTNSPEVLKLLAYICDYDMWKWPEDNWCDGKVYYTFELITLKHKYRNWLEKKQQSC